MLSLAVVLVVLVAIGLMYAAYKFSLEKFQPGYELERSIGGYGATLGDKRSMAAQNFGIDDSLAGVFSARILTPWDYYARIRHRNMELARTAECKLACSAS